MGASGQGIREQLPMSRGARTWANRSMVVGDRLALAVARAIPAAEDRGNLAGHGAGVARPCNPVQRFCVQTPGTMSANRTLEPSRSESASDTHSDSWMLIQQLPRHGTNAPQRLPAETTGRDAGCGGPGGPLSRNDFPAEAGRPVRPLPAPSIRSRPGGRATQSSRKSSTWFGGSRPIRFRGSGTGSRTSMRTGMTPPQMGSS